MVFVVLLLQLKDETERAKEEHEEMKQQFKKQKEHEKKWESTRDTRVGTWREYMNKVRGGVGAAGSLYRQYPPC